MSVNKKTDVVDDFFESMKHMELGCYKTGITKENNDGWWTFDHHIAGESRPPP